MLCDMWWCNRGQLGGAGLTSGSGEVGGSGRAITVGAARTGRLIGAALLAVPVLAGLTGCAAAPVAASGAAASTGSAVAPSVGSAAGSSVGSAAGSSVGSGAGSAGAQAIPVGPGPQSSYTVQPQPAPGSCHYRRQGAYPLPDPACTPGATNPKVNQATSGTTICRSGGGYTSSIRPPAGITGREKAANAKSYGYTGSFTTGEYDHLISLELGGDPNDPRNLWVEPNDRSGATGTNNSKDAVENAAHDAVCSGKLTLAEVQQGIVTDWPSLGRRLGVPLP
jgi:hypothetical protein